MNLINSITKFFKKPAKVRGESTMLSSRQMATWLKLNVPELNEFSRAELELALDDREYIDPKKESGLDAQLSDAAWVHSHQQALGLSKTVNKNGQLMSEAFTQADIELALDDRGWLVGGKRMMGELDPLSRQVQVNRSRYYWLRDPLAKQAVRLWTDYALGDTAVSWHCEDASVQKKLDDFMSRRINRRYCSRQGMRRLSQRLLVDGELFFGIFDDGEIKTFDCLQITDIITDPDDEDRVIAYKRVTTPPAYSQGQNKVLYYKPWDLDDDSPSFSSKDVANDGYNLVPIDPQGGKDVKYEDGVVMYHLAFDNIERRGNGLITCCSDWTREHRRFMIARVAIMQAIKKFAFTTQVKGGQNVVNSIRAKLETTFAQTGLSGGTEHQPVAAPGANFVGNEGITLKAMPQATGSGDAVGDANQLKLMVSAGTGIMLHYFGDPSTGNLATATAMELPMLKQFASYQVLWKDTWRDLFAIVLGEKDGEEPAQITIDMPDILEDDLQPLSQFITALTTVFPEAKVPALLKQCLQSANVNDLDEVMEDIEAQKEENDAQQALQMKQQHQIAMTKAKQPKPGVNSTDPQQQGVLNPDTPGAVAESDPITLLTKALTALKESLQ